MLTATGVVMASYAGNVGSSVTGEIIVRRANSNGSELCDGDSKLFRVRVPGSDARPTPGMFVGQFGTFS